MKSKTISMFLATYEYGSLSQAANEMEVSKQTVSRSMKLLEEELGVKLFKKIKDGSYPTQECHKVYKIIKNLKEDIDSIEDYYKMKHNPYSVRIADNNVESITKYYNMALQKYRSNDVLYTFENIDAKEIYDRLIKGECDIGIFVIPKAIEKEIRDDCEANNVKLEVLLETGPCILINNTHPLIKLSEVTPDDLTPFQRADLIRKNEEQWFFNKYLEDINIDIHADIKTNSFTNALISVKDTDCYFMSLYFENDAKHLEYLKMIPLINTDIDIVLFLGYNKKHLYDNVAKDFMELVKRHYRGEEIEGWIFIWYYCNL